MYSYSFMSHIFITSFRRSHLCLLQIYRFSSIFRFTLDMTFLIHNLKCNYHPPAHCSKIYLNSVGLSYAILNIIFSVWSNNWFHIKLNTALKDPSIFFCKSSSLHYLSRAMGTLILLYLILSINSHHLQREPFYSKLTSLLPLTASLYIFNHGEAILLPPSSHQSWSAADFCSFYPTPS